jgi:catechol 2,3-dioxygenase-like lactoylglutathione lyase family enzyme
MAILRIERVVYGVTDIAECSRFFTEFGLAPVPAPDDRASGGPATVFRTQAGQEIEIRPQDDPELPAPLEPGSTVREVVWGVDTQQALDALAGNLARDRQVRRDPDGSLHTLDETGYGIGFALAAVTEAGSDASANYWADNTHGQTARWNKPIDPVGDVRPMRLCHVALNIPKEGREAAAGFYTGRLGFRATDVVEPMGVFMRAEGDFDQHTMLLCHRPDKAGINHTAYQVDSFDEVIVGANRMIEHGWHEARRLGRHTIGSNVFRFIHAPCGGRVEFAADMDRVDDTYPTRTWETAPPHHLWTVRTNRGENE